MKQTQSEKRQKPVSLPGPKRDSLAYGTIGKAVLTVVAVTGVLALVLVAPNLAPALGLLERQYRKSYKRYRSPAYLRKTVRSLCERGLVYVVREKGGLMLRLTEKGKRELVRYQLQEKALRKQWRWDKKWRILVFDVEERRRVTRDRLRDDLRTFGFVRIQDSVWVYPYPCEEVITLLKAEYRLGKQLLTIEAGEVENDAWIRKKFHLS